jgi:hypothetical protein
VHEIVTNVSDGADRNTLVLVSKLLRTAVHQTCKGLKVQGEDEPGLQAALALVERCSSMSALRLHGCVSLRLGVLPRRLDTVELVDCAFLTSLDGLPERLKVFKVVRCGWANARCTPELSTSTSTSMSMSTSMSDACIHRAQVPRTHQLRRPAGF